MYAAWSATPFAEDSEIGLRVALGAPSLRILQLVFSEGLPLSAAGSAAGVAAALLLSRIMRSFVHDIPPVDLISLAVVPLIALFVVVVGAAALPVRRALRVQPDDRAAGGVGSIRRALKQS